MVQPAEESAVFLVLLKAQFPLLCDLNSCSWFTWSLTGTVHLPATFVGGFELGRPRTAVTHSVLKCSLRGCEMITLNNDKCCLLFRVWILCLWIFVLLLHCIFGFQSTTRVNISNVFLVYNKTLLLFWCYAGEHIKLWLSVFKCFLALQQ